jgi:hypothetical protein
MAVVRLHRGCMKRAYPQFMPSLEAVPRACLGYMREHAHSGHVLLRSKTEACVASTDSSTVEKCGTISSEASFSSSLKFYVFMDSVSGWRLLCLLCAQYTTSHAVAAITKFVKLVRVKNDPDKAKYKEARLERDGGRKRA